MKDITVIIPCYNGFKYMSNCLRALERQSFKNFEVVVIDDCSIDDSYENIKRYAQQSKLEIRVYKNEVNKRLALTRQIGVSKANTEWICFCDCDDWLDESYLKKMLSSAKKNESDIVMCNFNYAYPDGSFRKQHNLDYLSNSSTKEEIIAYSLMSMCNCIFKRKLFSNLLVPHINNAEDGAVSPQLFSKAGKISIIHDGLYNYFMRNESLSSTPSESVCRDFLKAQEVVNKTVGHLYPAEVEFIGIKNICYGVTLNAIKADLPQKKISYIYKRFLSDNPNWYHNQYMKSLPLRKKVFLFFVYKQIYFPLIVFSKLHSRLARG